MDASVEVLEKYGLAADEDSFRVAEFDNKKTSKLHRELYESIFTRQRERFPEDTTVDPFSFMASASLRGHSTCSSPFCRLQKFDFVGRYTALYANRVLFPLPLRHPSIKGNIGEIRDELVHSALMLLRLRPLVDAGLIVPAVTRTTHCVHTADWVNNMTGKQGTVSAAIEAPSIKGNIGEIRDELVQSALMLLRLRPLVDAGLIVPAVTRTTHCVHTADWVNNMTGLVHEIADDAATELQKQFRVVYQTADKSPTGQATVYIHGPEDFLEHGGGVLLVNDEKVWRPKRARVDRYGNAEIRGPMKVAAVRWVLDQVANDTTFYLAYGRMQNTRYLTDRPGETYFLDWLTDDEELAASNAAMNAYLTHSLPLLGDLPLTTLLRIRQEERDSFLRYRSGANSGRKPQLRRMKSELYQEGRRQRRRIVGGLGTLAATVALGAFGGVVPVLIKASMAAAGSMVGGRLLSKAAEATCEHGSTLREKNDFYFLLRLTQEAENI